MRLFKLKNLTSSTLRSVLFPIDTNTGEAGYSYEALQVMRYEGDCLVCLTVDGITHTLSSGSFVYGFSIHPDSDIEIHSNGSSKSGYTFYCQAVAVPYDPSGGDSLLVEQPKDESDAYDAFLQAHKTLHQNIYSGEYEDEDDSDLDQDHVLSDYEDDEIPTPYELADDPMADEIEDRIRRVPADPPEPSETGSDVPPAKPKEVDPPKEA